MRKLIPIVILALLAPRGSAKDPTKGKVYKTPKAAFEAMRTAYRSQKFAAFYRSLTHRSQEQVLTQTFLMAASVYQEDKLPKKPQDRERVLKLRKSVRQFGLTKEKFLAIEDFKGKGRKDRDAYFASRARKLIKDLPKFVDTMAKAMFEMQTRERGQVDLELVGDLKIKGNVARGKMKLKLENEPESQQSIMFIKVGDGWKIAMTEAQEEDRASRKVEPPVVVDPKEKE